jgi:hypothetical protein
VGIANALARTLRRRATTHSEPLEPEPVKRSRVASGRPADLDWQHIDAAATADHPTLIDDLLARRHDGITISGVFTQAEVTRAVADLAGTGPVRRQAELGSVLGMPIGQIGPDSQDRTLFLDDTDQARALYRAAFGFDPHTRVADVLAPMAGGLPLVPPVEHGREYNPGQVRWFEPGCGGLRAHCGNEFRDILKSGAMSHLVSTTRVEDHLSYFVVLQTPEVGGSLSVFDLRLDDFAHEESWGTGRRDDSFIDDVPALTVDPEPGSLVLFGGGWRWHRIEPVEGTRPRVTYGGFCAPSVAGDAIHFWT